MKIRTILFPTDLSERANAAWHLAASLARDMSAEVVILHVRQLPVGSVAGAEPSVEELRPALEELAKDEQAFPIRREIVTGEPAPSIVRIAAEHDANLIVMATHGRTGLARLLMGSVAEKVMRESRCPVLTVKMPDAVEDDDDLSVEAAHKSEQSGDAVAESRRFRQPDDAGDGSSIDVDEQREFEQEFRNARERLQQQLQATPGSGKLAKWAGDVREAALGLQPLLVETFENKHKALFAQIKKQDADLFVRVEQLMRNDAEILDEFDQLLQRVEALICDASIAGGEKTDLKQEAEAFARDGLEWLVRVAAQEKEVATWFLEAFHRDRGAVD